MHKVEYLPFAQADVLDAVNYLAVTLDAPQAARNLLDELESCSRAGLQVPLCQRALSHRPPHTQRDPQTSH